MKEDARKGKPPDSPPWTAVLTSLALALVAAWLVAVKGWEPWKALSVVSVGSLVFIFLLFAALLIWAGPENRSQLWRECWLTCGEDLDLLFKLFRIRR